MTRKSEHMYIPAFFGTSDKNWQLPHCWSMYELCKPLSVYTLQQLAACHVCWVVSMHSFIVLIQLHSTAIRRAHRLAPQR